MSARQPFFPVRPGSKSQETIQSFNQKNFSMDSSNPLHLTSQATGPVATSQSESTKGAFSVPGPFSSNSTDNAPQAKISGIGGLSRKKSAHNLSQSVEKDRKGSLNSLGFLDLSNARPGTAAPRSEAHEDPEVQHSFGYQKPSRRSILDASGIVRPGTVAPQSRPVQDFAAGLDIRAPIPMSAALISSTFLSHSAFSDRIPENDAHIFATETKNRASRNVENTGDLTCHSYDTSEVDHKPLNPSLPGHEVTADGRLKMSVTKKRNRDVIEEGGDGSYWVESQAKRLKSHHREEFETREYAKSPPARTNSRSSHPEGNVRRHFPDARESPRSPRYREHRTTSPVNERAYESPQAGQSALDNTGNAFEKVLGRDTDAFMKQNMEKYDRLVKKWSECSEEEWLAGAEEIAEKYTKIVSYVKDAMLAKVNTFANIQLDIGRHLSELGERDKLLDAARKKLIMESGNALG